jgi:hypothetical protein
VKWVAAALVALAGCGAAVGILVIWLTFHAPEKYTGWVVLGSFGLAAFSVLLAALVAEAKIEVD